MPDPITHHPFSPSTLQRLSLCPGSWRMTKDIPEPPQSENAAEGTKLHEAVATGNMDGLTAEQQTLLEDCMQFESVLSHPSDTIEHEVRLDISDYDGNQIVFGTADVVLVHEDGNSDIIDWKFGRTPAPSAEGNFQLAAYALGVFQKWNCKAVTCHIYQPRLHFHSEYTFTKPKNILCNILSIISKAQSEIILLCASDEACRYCRAASTCPACNQRYGLVPADVQNNMLTDPDKLLTLWERAQMATKLVEQIKAAVTDYINEHGSLGDWTLEQRDGKREISDVSKLYERVAHMMNGHDLSECYTVKLSAVLDKLTERYQKLAEHNGEKMLKKEAKKRAEELIEDLIVRAPGTAVLTKGAKK